MRRTARAMFGAGVGLAGVLGVAVAVAVFIPLAEVRAERVPIAAFDALPQGIPVRVTSTELSGLDLKAQQLRSKGTFGRPRGTVKDLPVFLVRDSEDVRGFIGIDPRNGCELELLPDRMLWWGDFPTMFHDVCHGSIYNFSGQKIGGPSPWDLDELSVTVKDGRVYSSTTVVIPGRWSAGGR